MKKYLILLLIPLLLVGCTKQEKKTDEIKKDVKLPVNVIGRYEEDYKLKTNYKYNLDSVHEVDGRQGIAYENNTYYVSGSTTLSKYDKVTIRKLN